MHRILSLTALFLALALAAPPLVAPAFAATGDAPSQDQSVKKKKPTVARHARRWTVPPGYRTPEQIEREKYKSYRRERAFAVRHNVPRVYYYYWGEPYYNGRFGGNRRDTLRVGPCWTQTPIGPVWNCGN